MVRAPRTLLAAVAALALSLGIGGCVVVPRHGHSHGAVTTNGGGKICDQHCHAKKNGKQVCHHHCHDHGH